jgi:hypothetical protein
MRDRMGGLLKGRSSYAMMISAGLVAHGVTSRYADYWSSMYSAAPVETSGLYAGNYFQMLQSQREAQAIRQSAAMRASWAGAQIGSTGLMGLAPMLALGVANPLIGLGLAGASMGGGIFLNMWSSKGQAAEQSRIDTQTARTLAGIQTAQARQSSSIQFASAVANLAPFNMLNQGADQIFKGRGQAVGYGAVETLGFMNSFAQAGGNLNSTLAERIPDLLRYKNIRPETLGALSRGTLPGGGIDPRFITTNPILRSTDEFMFTTSMGYANAAGIDASRINEWFQRQAAFNARYAERGLTVSPTAQTDILKSYGNPKLKGLSQAAFTENIQQFGMGVADELTESMMPKRLAQALMLQRAISNGGGPGEWYKKLSHPVMTAAIGSEVEKSLPAMLRPFFAAQVTGMVPEMATFRGGGVKPTSTPSTPTGTPSSGSGTGTGNKAVDAAIEALQITAEANNQYLQKWQTTIVMASKQLDAIQEAIRNSAGSIPVAP